MRVFSSFHLQFVLNVNFFTINPKIFIYPIFGLFLSIPPYFSSSSSSSSKKKKKKQNKTSCRLFHCSSLSSLITLRRSPSLRDSHTLSLLDILSRFFTPLHHFPSSFRVSPAPFVSLGKPIVGFIFVCR